MKKNLKNYIAGSLFLLATVFCFAQGKNNSKKFPSPDEAVLVYVLPGIWCNKILFSQLDPSKPVSKVTDIARVDFDTQVVYGFCIPDTEYSLVYEETGMDTFTLYFNPLNNTYNNFTTQKKCGVQMLNGNFSVIAKHQNDSPEKWERFCDSFYKDRIDSVNKLISIFEETEWEPLLREELGKAEKGDLK